MSPRNRGARVETGRWRAGARALTFAATLIAICAVCCAALLAPRRGPAAPTPAAAPPLRLELGLLLQRETAERTWRPLRTHRALARGDELQLTIKPEQPGHLLVAFADPRGAPRIVYPLPGQSGAVRGGWAYALPDPSRSYRLDGAPTRLLVLLSRDPLPDHLEGRLDALRAAARRPAVGREPAPPVQLPLRDGTPASVPITRFSAHQPLVAAVDL